MSKGRHDNGRSTAPYGIVIGAVSLAGGLVMLPLALTELFRYSPYEDPGAGQAGLWLGIGFLVFAGLPVLWLAAKVLSALYRSYAAWKRTLTPEQRAILVWAELAAMTATHLAWREHNKHRDAELTASVMGDASKYDYLARGALDPQR